MALSKVDLANQVENQLPQGLVANNLPYRNLIINGDMSIAQRSTSVASITSTGYYTVDRFASDVTTLGTWTQSQETDVPTGQGFAKSLKMNCTTADAAPAAADRMFIKYKIEGQNLQYLKKGTASAESVTASFWVKSNKTGTYICELFDGDNSRHINKSYTIDASNTWEKKTITFEGDTIGAFDNDNSSSLQLGFWLSAGSNYTSGTLQTSWGANATANRAVGNVNLADSTSNYINITGVQLEAGTTASDFEFLPFDVNLGRCQRYYSIAKFMTGVAFDATNIRFGASFNPTMRTSPTLGTTGALQFTDGYSADKAQSSGNVSVFDTSAYAVWGQAGNFSSLTTGRAYFGNRFFNSGLISLDAEM